MFTGDYTAITNVLDYLFSILDWHIANGQPQSLQSKSIRT